VKIRLLRKKCKFNVEICCLQLNILLRKPYSVHTNDKNAVKCSTLDKSIAILLSDSLKVSLVAFVEP
jgi:hypothetical protein